MSSNTVKSKAQSQTNEDWHWADVVAAIRKRGWSLRQVALQEGYASGQPMTTAKKRPYPKVEAILARYAGIEHPSLIWPSRYDEFGMPNRQGYNRPKPLRGLPPLKSTSLPKAGNPQRRAAF